MSSPQKSWECNTTGCGKRFSRKEHLNRHNLTHESVHQHRCPICEKRYARSDVLKRHLKQHKPQISDIRRVCVPCGEQNIPCDGNSPCGTCVSNWIECRWTGSSHGHGSGTAAHLVHVNPPTSTDETVPASGPSLETPSSGDGQAWFPAESQTWTSGPASYSVTPPYSLLPNSLDTYHQAQEVVNTMGVNTGGPSVDTVRVEPAHHQTSNNYTRSSQPVSPPTSQPHSTVDSYESAALVKINAILNGCLPNTRRLIDVFFSEIHPHWAILHAPTFETSHTPAVLVSSMVMLASWLENGVEHRELAPALFEELNQVRMDLHPRLHVLQAILFYIVYATCCLTEDGMVARALNLSGLLISTCRHLGIFNGQYIPNEISGKESECPFTMWRIQEQLNRIAFDALRVDAYLSILLDHPPSVRYQELCIPLPKSQALWAAANDDERRKLQWNEPAGREKALFSFFMRDALDPNRVGNLPYRLTDIDYHLSICAIQAPLWTAAREAHSSMSDELVPGTDPNRPLKDTRVHLTLWRDKQKQNCGVSVCDVPEQYFSGALRGHKDHLLAPLTITLMYLSTLRTYAPLNLLRVGGHYYKSRSGSCIPTRKRQAHLRQWIRSNCARSSLWTAAQIGRVFRVESACSSPASSPVRPLAHLRLNPLLVPGLLTSAIVACSYAWHTRSCELCTPDAHVPSPPVGTAAATPVYLFDVAPDDPALEEWKRQGDASGFVPYWGTASAAAAHRVPVCKCRLTDIAAWFREALTYDDKAEMEFVLFLAELSRDA
ncbi:hypothetical protein GGR52DRAFT_558229 [Hypoxylon sp. FL1284]|nr:hypothetical protein GGR52DRAFT_558229 [Hypoxylon sp. FL1284]